MAGVGAVTGGAAGVAVVAATLSPRAATTAELSVTALVGAWRAPGMSNGTPTMTAAVSTRARKKRLSTWSEGRGRNEEGGYAER
jgi:hypothetical protein